MKINADKTDQCNTSDEEDKDINKDINNETLQILHHEMKENMLLLNMMVDIFGKVVEAPDLHESLLNIFTQVGEYISFPLGVLVIRQDNDEENAENADNADNADNTNRFRIFGGYGIFCEEMKKTPLEEKEDSLVYCVRDIGSSLIVPDIINDNRFNQHELFQMNESLSAIAKCISFDGNVYAILLFYTYEKDLIYLRGVLNKIDKIISIIRPHLQVRMNIEKELKKTETEKNREKKWAQSLLQIVCHDINNLLYIINLSVEGQCL
ncbi:MAG: hypothetical protein HQK53_13740, partial [Oligoflexia bacterium]|nr:hypothetical protein [Oligoflexia bacterium]